MNEQQFHETYAATVSSLRDNLPAILPDSLYRDYCLWALSPENPHQRTWEHLMGIPQFVQLTLALFDGIVDAEDQQQLIAASIPMNIYLMFEVVSDDLAIGLAHPNRGDSTYFERRHLLDVFNDAMVKRLKGHLQTTETLLSPIREITQRVSGFEQSLIPDSHNLIAKTYLGIDSRFSVRDLEYALWPRLIANIETCVIVANEVADLRSAPLVRAGLINRYRAVTALLEDPFMALPKRVSVSADAILVVPTLAYYTGILAERIHPIEEFQTVLDNGLLAETLYDAAILVRLLNDVGTTLLTDAGTRRDLLDFLRRQTLGTAYPRRTFGDLLCDSLDEFGSIVTRLRKDLTHGEFNLSLFNLDPLSGSQALPLFEKRLHDLAALYEQTHRQFEQRLATLDEQLGAQAIGKLIKHFVDFHASLYTHEYTDAAGEYTVSGGS